MGGLVEKVTPPFPVPCRPVPRSNQFGMYELGLFLQKSTEKGTLDKLVVHYFSDKNKAGTKNAVIFLTKNYVCHLI